ncbi:MAG: transposase [Planctomycetota bacterium]|nr:MAG: transposase [Planctomycetota bacterium]
MNTVTKIIPRSISDGEWEFVCPYLSLLPSDSRQMDYSQRELFDALRYMISMEDDWGLLPTAFPPVSAVYHQALMWKQAAVFQEVTNDLREMIRWVRQSDRTDYFAGADVQATAINHVGPSLAEHNHRRKINSLDVCATVDLQNCVIDMTVITGGESDESKALAFALKVSILTDGNVQVNSAARSCAQGVDNHCCKNATMDLSLIPDFASSRGYVLFPQRWAVEHSFDWLARFCRLARDYERLAESLKRLDFWPDFDIT